MVIKKLTWTCMRVSWCWSSRVCLANARSQSLCQLLTSWVSWGVWGSRCSSGRAGAGWSFNALLFSGTRKGLHLELNIQVIFLPDDIFLIVVGMAYL